MRERLRRLRETDGKVTHDRQDALAPSQRDPQHNFHL